MNVLDQIMDTYEVVEQLGEGSGGTVFKAFHKRLRTHVVLKRLHNNDYTEFVQRKEVDILKQLSHSYLPKVLDFLQLENEVYTVMSYVKGQTFQQLLDAKRTFSTKQIIQWGIQLCEALAYLHRQKPPIIHGDIKPANIMLTPEGTICLIDFNISFFVDEKAVLGYTGGYTSPEQYICAMNSLTPGLVAVEKPINEQSDIYSLGATLYRIATGKKITAYKQGVDMEYLTQLSGETFAQILKTATEIDPDRRFASAKQMKLVLQNIAKNDKRYQKLLFKQRCEVLVCAGLFLLATGMSTFGLRMMKAEKEFQYNEMIQEQIGYIKEADYQGQESIYKQAIAVKYEDVEAHYQNAYSLYAQREYEECVTFIDVSILENSLVNITGERMIDVYYLKADSLFRLEDYEAAVRAYEKVMEYESIQPGYYRDYAIALAYHGDEKEAEDVLEKAILNGLKEDSVYYVKGELAYALSKTGNAIQEFDNCIKVTEDDYMKMRAYVMKSQMLEENGEFIKSRETLLRAREEVEITEQLGILERLVAINLKLALEDEKHFTEAIEASEELIKQGWGTYTTYNNLVVLYQKLEMYEKAYQQLEEMKNKFGEDYNLYKRYAFLEVEQQERVNNASRDYKQFEQYYQKSATMYSEERNNNKTDSEMQTLEQLYQQMKAGGWLHD